MKFEVESKVIKGFVTLQFTLSINYVYSGAQSAMSLRRIRDSEKWAKKLQNNSASKSQSEKLVGSKKDNQLRELWFKGYDDILT